MYDRFFYRWRHDSGVNIVCFESIGCLHLVSWGKRGNTLSVYIHSSGRTFSRRPTSTDRHLEEVLAWESTTFFDRDIGTNTCIKRYDTNFDWNWKHWSDSKVIVRPEKTGNRWYTRELMCFGQSVVLFIVRGKR